MRSQPLSKGAVLGDDRKTLSSICDCIAQQQIKLLFRQIAHQPTTSGGDKCIVGEKQHGNVRGVGNGPCFGNRARKQRANYYVTLCRDSLLGGAATTLAAHRVKHHQLNSGITCGKQRQFCALA